MTLWTATDSQLATGGQLLGGQTWVANGVSIDTRTLEEGDLFVALKDQRDGHDFVADALANGAVAALVSYRPEGLSYNAPLLIVDDVLRGLEDLALFSRDRSEAKIVAITGSVGKTSTKDMLRHVLGAQAKTHAAEKSYNNHWGVPLTLARLPQDAKYAVIEIGMNHPGEIEPLARLTNPHVAVVTTVAPAHLEAFNSVDDIAVEKASIFSGLDQEGVAIFNGDVPQVDILARSTTSRAVTFGQSEGADWRLSNTNFAMGKTVCEVRSPNGGLLFKLSVPGRHFAINALAVLAAVEAIGADLARAVLSLPNWQPGDGRGAIYAIMLDDAAPGLKITLIDDAYNANPASTAAALHNLAGIERDHRGSRKIAFLADMKELGPKSPQFHAKLVQDIGDIDVVHTVGAQMRNLYSELPQDRRGVWVETSDELAKQIGDLVEPGDIVAVKGSLSMNMARVVDAVKNLGQVVPQNSNEVG